jgi:hypothetical protein
MPSRDTGKWVQRAGATGGGRTYRGQMPIKWYGSLVLICVLGVALVVYSRYELQHPAPAVQPAVGVHWYQAFGFDVCGNTLPNLPANPNASRSPIPGIRTDGDGVIQVAPTTSQDAGNNATLARFVALYPHLELSTGVLGIPGHLTYRNGERCPSGTPDANLPGTVLMKVWPSFTGPGASQPTTVDDPAAVKLADGQLITIAFVRSGASIPKPPATTITAMLNDRQGAATSTPSTGPTTPVPTTTAPTTTAPTTTAPTAKSPTTTAPSSATTTAPASPSTTKPSATSSNTNGR